MTPSEQITRHGRATSEHKAIHTAPRPNLVPRPHLTQRLEEGLRLNRKVTLISAPAGFGKSTLISEWVASTNRPVTWVSLDAGDNDPVQFWSYFIGALRAIYPNVGTQAQNDLVSADPPPVETVLASLINKVAAEQLYISVHTVRTHIKSIYGKLDVHSHQDAIDRAQELELI